MEFPWVLESQARQKALWEEGDDGVFARLLFVIISLSRCRVLACIPAGHKPRSLKRSSI